MGCFLFDVEPHRVFLHQQPGKPAIFFGAGCKPGHVRVLCGLSVPDAGLLTAEKSNAAYPAVGAGVCFAGGPAFLDNDHPAAPFGCPHTLLFRLGL